MSPAVPPSPYRLPGEAIPEGISEDQESLEYATPNSSSVSSPSHQSQGSYSDGGLEEPLPSPGASPGTKNPERSPGRREERNGKGRGPEDVGLAAKEVALSLDGDGESSDSVSGYDTAAEVLPPPQNGERKDAESKIERQTGKAQAGLDEDPLPATSVINGSQPPVTEPRCTDSSSISVVTQDHQQVAVEPQHTALEPHTDGALNATSPSHTEVKSQTCLQPSATIQSLNAPLLSPHTPTSSPKSQSPSRLSPAPGTGTLAPFTPPLSPHAPSSSVVPRTPSQSSSASEGARELQYESLQPGKTVPVVVSWVASPSAFVVSLARG